MSVQGMLLTVLATQIAEAVAKDETPEVGGCDISAGMFGPNFSQLLREIVGQLDERQRLYCALGEMVQSAHVHIVSEYEGTASFAERVNALQPYYELLTEVETGELRPVAKGGAA